MSAVTKLTKADVRRGLVRYHFAPFSGQMEVFERLRSVQFDPLAPAGSNHDLVLQARLPEYKIGDWQKTAYEDRLIYDGWDKMASLIPFEGWPVRRIFHSVHRRNFEKKIFEDHKEAVDTVLKEIEERGPLMPKDFDFQQRRPEWKGSWYGPSVTKQTLRALWHSGLVMTAGRKNGQHLYDLTGRIVPKDLLNEPRVSDDVAIRELVLERHRAMGLVRPTAPPEVWSNQVLTYRKREAMAELVDRGEIVPVEVEGVAAHATPEFLDHLDQPSLEPRVAIIAPLDPFMWDRKMTGHIFGFDYTWEVYVPEPKRRWGYYVLPVLYGNALVARVEFWARGGKLDVRQWYWEEGVEPDGALWSALESAMRGFMRYSSTKTATTAPHIKGKIRSFFKSLK
ncbi:MAG TPA: crosslink repair DNA glycosylase YcaQ family protein [Fimbriimonadaceae bacterium]|nr:crosslink repair DNA glycosylase YcaQ family protein [Fimbriimonadaceae bacterium]